MKTSQNVINGIVIIKQINILIKQRFLNKIILNIVDLHMHSSYSDGSFSPPALVEIAAKTGIKALALTDHDTLAGCAEFKAAGAEKGILCLSGLELSVHYEDFGIHLLGYKVDLDCPALNKNLAEFRVAREACNRKIIEKLKKIGLALDYAEIQHEYPKSHVLNRLHLARHMIQKKIVASIPEAFELYLGEGKQAYVPKKYLSFQTAVDLVHQASGKIFLAHPNRLSMPVKELERQLPNMVDQGLDGVEVYHPSNTAQDSEYFKRVFVKPYNLLTSGGSDFHSNHSRSKVGYINQHTRLGGDLLSDWFYQ